MADGVAITAGSGTTVATDDVGGAHYQLVKVVFGALDAATLVTAAVGLPTEDIRPATATVTAVNDTASSTQLLASTAGRKGSYFLNDSTSVLYVKLGTTASTTDHTVQLGPGAFWELPVPCYTGRIDGIWASDASGAVRITELT